MADAVNGLYESLGGLFIAFSIWRLWHDKQCKGISLVHVLFFWSWGFWNLYFYPAVGAWYSFYGGIGIVIVQSIWLAMILYYRRK